ncbi:hypothetical protein PAPHI01_2418 [Pancytospora philotis]|nr:hypothetical protein PAPHI01_2257 [Pancytospora philotis]KAI4293144.1 hypothetical protein PAPHI01_2418 [Pancytospora philotis]
MRCALAAVLVQGLLAYRNRGFGIMVNAITAPFRSVRNGKAYVNPDGPLNILRGHRLVSDNIIAKKRLFSPPFRAEYTCEYNPASSDCTWSWTGQELLLPADDSPTALYLSKYYAAMEVLFDIVREDDNFTFEKSHILDTYFNEHENLKTRLNLFAVMLVLAGGGDIQVAYDEDVYGDDAVVTCRVGAYELLKIDKYALEDAEYPPDLFSSLCTIIEFFHEYGGPRAADVAGFGLHYSDTPSFLAQAYIAGFFSEPKLGRELLVAVDRILARRYKDSDFEAVWKRFFTKGPNPFDIYINVFEALDAMGCLTLRRYLFPDDEVTLDEGDRAFFTALIRHSPATGGSFYAVMQQSMKSFLVLFTGLASSDTLVADVEIADSPMAYYIALTRWLACRPMGSLGDKLAAIDQLMPAFIKLLEDKRNGPERSAKLAHHPLVLFIANVLGTVSDTEWHIRELFFEIMRYCPAERDELFPCIKIPADQFAQLQELVDECPDSDHPLYCVMYSNVSLPNTICGYLKLGSPAVYGSRGENELADGVSNFLNNLGCVDGGRLVDYVVSSLVETNHREGMKLLSNYYCRTVGAKDYALLLSWFRVCDSYGRHKELRTICRAWQDPFCMLSLYQTEQRYLRTDRKFTPLSKSLVRKILSEYFDEERLKSLLWIYTLFAERDADYDALLTIFKSYPQLLDANYAVSYAKATASAYCRIIRDWNTSGRLEEALYLLPTAPIKRFIGRLKDLYSEQQYCGDQNCCEAFDMIMAWMDNRIAAPLSE